MQQVVFGAFEGSTGREYYVSDGETTTRIGDIAPGPFSSFANFGGFAALGTEGFLFAANDGTGFELWVSDGTPGGTGLLLDINAGNASSSPNNMEPVGDEVYFSIFNSETAGQELWVSDGTLNGTRRVSDLASAGVSIGSIEAFADGVIFVASDDANGGELWFSDGTESGTILLRDINPGPDFSSPSAIGSDGASDLLIDDGSNILDDLFFFSADDGTNGPELWATDGTPGGTRLVSNISPGAGGFVASNFQAFDGRMYFSYDDGVNGSELWVSDGTDAGTQLFANIRAGGSASNPSWLTPFGDVMLFTAQGDTAGAELWVTDGTSEGTTLLKDIEPGGFGSFPRGASDSTGFVEFGGKVYFRATTSAEGTELWVTDGTEEGTELFLDFVPGPGNGDPFGLVATDTDLFFSITTPEAGIELWATDGTVEGTRLVSDIFPGEMSSTPTFLGVIGESELNGTITGTPEDDQLSNGGPGNDMIDGLAGRDTVSYPLTRDEVSETRTGDSAATITTPDGTDTLTSVERVLLEDGVYIYDIDGSVESSAFTYRIYDAAYGRLPDEAGFRFWEAGTSADAANPISKKELAEFFLAAPEAMVVYGEDLTDEEFITALYNVALRRDPDDEGFDFWLDQFSSGAQDRADMLVFFAESPENIARNADNLDDGIFLLEDFTF